MNCEQFRNWLENRDLADNSESDRALRHSRVCANCRDLLEKDGLLDQAITRALAHEQTPDQFEKLVSVSLGGSSTRRRIPTGWVRLASLCCGLAALLLVLFLLPNEDTARNRFGAALARDHEALSSGHPLDPIEDPGDWLKTHAQFPAELPADFNHADLVFVGVQICIINDCRTVHLVYRQGQRLVSLFLIDAGRVPAKIKAGTTYTFEHDGAAIRLWRDRQYLFAVVS